MLTDIKNAMVRATGRWLVFLAVLTLIVMILVGLWAGGVWLINQAPVVFWSLIACGVLFGAWLHLFVKDLLDGE